MTTRDLITALYENVTFPPGTANKRFVRDMAAKPADYQFSDRAEAYAWRIAYRFRRQLPKSIADEAVARKVPHRWIPDGDDIQKPWRCEVCRGLLFSERERNAPCPGPPAPKPEKRRKVKVEQRVKNGAVEFDAAVIPQESLF